MEIKVEIRKGKKKFYFNFSNIKKIVEWQDEFFLFNEDGICSRFGLLEVNNIWANGNKIYEKH